MAHLANATFETGIQGWMAVNDSSHMFPSWIQNGAQGTARSGTGFLRVQATRANASVGTDFLPLGPQTPRSLACLAYVRAPGNAVSATLKLWNLTNPGQLDHNDTNFVAGKDWSLIMCAIDLPTNGAQYPKIRVEFYVGTVSQLLDIDTVVVC